jgi:hypothetical protein
MRAASTHAVALLPLAVLAFCEAECGSSGSGASAGDGGINDAGANALADGALPPKAEARLKARPTARRPTR